MDGGFARAEVGAHPRENLTIFGFGEVSERLGGIAGAGLRLNF